MYLGVTGKIMIDNKEIAYISNWSVEDTTDIIEVTKLGSKHKEKLAGQHSWSASADGAIDFTVNSNQAALFEAKQTGDPVVCQFYLNKNDAKMCFTGTGFIESLSVDLSAEDKGNVSISISGTGELSPPAV